MGVTLDYISKADILIAGTIIYVVTHIICILHKIKNKTNDIVYLLTALYKTSKNNKEHKK